MQDEHVVIVGGGFGGINLASELAGKSGVRVTLVDRNNYNFFQPLLYQVATGLLEVSSIALPFRTILKGIRNVRFRLGELVRVDPEARVVHLSTGALEYDHLVLATGTETNFFGMESVEEEALPMKTLEEGLALRNHLLRKTEEATSAATPEARARLLTVVISGAGPTGVELAGMLAEMRCDLLEKIYPELDPGEVEVVLVDAAPAVLPPHAKDVATVHGTGPARDGCSRSARHPGGGVPSRRRAARRRHIHPGSHAHLGRGRPGNRP